MKNKKEIVEYIIKDIDENYNESKELVMGLLKETLDNYTIEKLKEFYQLD